jgi:hypothetical protein
MPKQQTHAQKTTSPKKRMSEITQAQDNPSPKKQALTTQAKPNLN